MSVRAEPGLAHHMRTYGVLGFVRLAVDRLWTRICFPTSRIVRRPFYVRGWRHIDLGHRLTVGVGLRIDAFPQTDDAGTLIRFGDDIEINDHVHIAAIARVTIGDNTLIASRVFIADHNHGRFDSSDPAFAPKTPPRLRPLSSQPVSIGRNVWIGEAVLIMPGVTIGDGAVIGGGSVVTRDIPAETLAVGNPARVIKRFDAATGQWIAVAQ